MKRVFLFSLLPGLVLISCKPKQADPAEKAGVAQSVEESEAKPADEGYVLFSEEFARSAGESVTMTEAMKMSGGDFTMDAAQGSFNGKMDMASTKELRLQTESAEKVKALVTKNEITQKMVINGQEMPQPPQVKPLVDVPLLATLADGVWTCAREDGSATGEADGVELEAVSRKLSRDQDRSIYGSEVRKPGDSWTVDAAETAMLAEAENVEGSIELTFDKVGEHEGIPCAFLSGTFDMQGSPPGEAGGGEGSMSLKGTFSIIRALDRQIDLFRELDGEMKLEMATPMGTMKMSGPTTITETAVIGE